MDMPKNIVVCSDGTGNSGGRSDGTNVWRIRQAVSTSDDKSLQQVVIYNDGVGTEGFRPLAILGLAFSYGVTRDLETLYERLMRVYEPGDRIYLFGYSRGAFTIRTFAFILYRCGLAGCRDGNKQLSEDQIKTIARKAIKAYKLRHTGLDQSFRDTYGLSGEELSFAQDWFDPSEYSSLEEAREDGKGRVPIEFVGVWDTVSAVGLPFHNVTQLLLKFWRVVTNVAPLNWLRLSLLNFERPPNKAWTEWEDDLHPYIRTARHALSVDDERETFYPQLWLEHLPCDPSSEGGSCTQVEIERTAAFGLTTVTETVSATTKPTDVEQVWFPGMHANVGGGYPKDHLAHVSLMWMI